MVSTDSIRRLEKDEKMNGPGFPLTRAVCFATLGALACDRGDDLGDTDRATETASSLDAPLSGERRRYHARR
jgi:hypothetical protein